MTSKLTQYRLCPRSRSVRLALAEYGLDVTLVDENPWEWRHGFLAKNPAGELPVLEFENGLTLCIPSGMGFIFGMIFLLY